MINAAYAAKAVTVIMILTTSRFSAVLLSSFLKVRKPIRPPIIPSNSKKYHCFDTRFCTCIILVMASCLDILYGKNYV